LNVCCETKLIFWYKIFSSIIGLRRLSRSFSKSLDKLRKSDIGRFDATFSGGLPGLSNMITSAPFKVFKEFGTQNSVVYVCKMNDSLLWKLFQYFWTNFIIAW